MDVSLTAGPRPLRLVALPPRLRFAAGAAGMATVIAGAVLIAVEAAHGHSHMVDDGHRVPKSVLGPLAGHGGNTILYEPRFWLLLAVMGAGYAVLVVAGSLPARAAIACIVGLHALVLIAPPI